MTFYEFIRYDAPVKSLRPSWLNQVAIWFGIFSRKALRGASFNSIEQLRQAIEALVAAYGPTAKPFMWRKRAVKASLLQN